MSTAVSDIIEDAYRQENIIAAGASLTTTETTEGLRILNRIVSNLLGHEFGEELTPWPVPPPQRTAPVAADFPLRPPKPDLQSVDAPYPPANTRLMCSATTAQTVYFPHAPADGARMQFVDVGLTATITFDGNGRTIGGATTVDVNSATESPTTWLYRDDLGNWVLLATLVSVDDLPFPAQYDDYFVNELAIRLCPRHGKTPGDATVEGRNNALRRIKERYRQKANSINNGLDVSNSLQAYDSPYLPFDTTF